MACIDPKNQSGQIVTAIIPPAGSPFRDPATTGILVAAMAFHFLIFLLSDRLILSYSTTTRSEQTPSRSEKRIKYMPLP